MSALAPSNLSGANVSRAAPKPKAGERSIEETYQKLSQLEHILLRPDTYIGSVEAVGQLCWVFDSNAKRMVQRHLNFVPGLYKIFDEIIVNAADNKQRDTTMNTIRVDINRDSGSISIYNNGRGIPVEIHKDHGCYVPELVFGQLLTSSNYNDNEQKVTGGRNGYGAKLANIFSTEFVVETSDSNVGMRFKQTFTDNMRRRTKPEIRPSKEDWTRVTFTPDMSKFGMEALDEDIIDLMTRRAVDVAGCTHSTVRVFFNGEKLPVNDFKSYVDLFLGPKGSESAVPRVFDSCGGRWEVCVAPSDEGFQQVSFVNSIATTKGGKHVEHIVDPIVAHLMEAVKKKDKSAASLKPHAIKSHLFVFVNCLIVNPTFDSQTKEHMTLVQSKFGSKCELSDKFLKQVASCDVVDRILSFLVQKNAKDLAKTNKSKRERLTGISKLDDANEAGGRNSQKCTLILTEGDSAKALAVSGLSIIGRDYYGVFPLRGKLLNVRDASTKQVADNAELSQIKQIIGLQHGKDYSAPVSLNTLRYGHIMIMTDQDHDGSHIKGLVINWIHFYWPSLLQHDGFLQEFVTPIVKASKGQQQIPFFTLPEYEQWRANTSTVRGWTIKYYKGLGTSTSAEAKEYFSDLPKHELAFAWTGDEDTQLIELAFSKKLAESRKHWLQGYKEGVHVDHSQATLPLPDFVNKELILFSYADNVRSIPSMVDGFKPGQRKVLFGCFKRKLKGEVKVAQLAGYIGEHSAYHHGEVSLNGTIVNMAQDYVGSNNINLLHPAGQFGTRLQGGKDHASARYIFTKLAAITRAIFPEADDPVLEYLEDDGQPIEPRFYVPVVPMVLINGAEGIGTGWSTYVPNYNPRDVVANLRRMIEGDDPTPMTPWYRGFTGSVEPGKEGQWVLTGRAEFMNPTTLLISELPLRKWTQDYKEFLEGLMNPPKAGEQPLVQDFKEHHTDTAVSFTVTLTNDGVALAQSPAAVVKTFKLASTVSESNMHLWNVQGHIRRYSSTNEVLRDFFEVRASIYRKRKAWMQEKLEAEWERLQNKVRFICAVVDGSLVISNRSKAVLVDLLLKEGYKPICPASTSSGSAHNAAPGEGQDEEGADGEDGFSPANEKSGNGHGYDYLLSMPLWSLTKEKVQALRIECEAKEAELSELLGKKPLDLWAEDLDNFERVYTDWLEEKEEHERGNADAQRRQRAAVGKGKGSGKQPAAPRTKKPAPAKKPARPVSKAADAEDYASSSVLSDPDDTDFVLPAARSRAERTKPVPSTQAEGDRSVPVIRLDQSAKPSAAPSISSLPKAPAKRGASAVRPGPRSEVVTLDADDDHDVATDVSLLERLKAGCGGGAGASVNNSTLIPGGLPAPLCRDPIDEFGFCGPEECRAEAEARQPVGKKPCARKATPPVRSLAQPEAPARRPTAGAGGKPAGKRSARNLVEEDVDYEQELETTAAAAQRPATKAIEEMRPARRAAAMASRAKWVERQDIDGDDDDEGTDAVDDSDSDGSEYVAR